MTAHASECPEKYFVAEQNDISNPNSKGLRYNEVPMYYLTSKIFFFSK